MEQLVTRACGAWCVIPEIADCPFLPPFSFFYQDLSHSSLLASNRYPVDELDDIRGHGKIIIDTSSHILPLPMLFFLI